MSLKFHILTKIAQVLNSSGKFILKDNFKLGDALALYKLGYQFCIWADKLKEKYKLNEGGTSGK